MNLDAHQHFWRYSPQAYGWISEGMQVLKKDFMPDDLRPLMQAVGIDGTVAVQARQTLEETYWLLELAEQFPFIVGVVGWVDLRSPQLREQLERLRAYPKLRGVRHVVQDEADDHFMLRDDFVRGIGVLSDYDLTYDILIFARHLPIACDLVSRFPEQRFVLDHIAKPFIKGKEITPWGVDLRRLAAYPNVYCKVSGMVTEADWKAWKPEEFSPYLDVVFNAFGARRIMLGSDWPVCTLAGSYGAVMNVVLDYVRQCSPTERAQVIGETARAFYGIS